MIFRRAIEPFISLLASIYGGLSSLERNFFMCFPFLVQRPSARVVSIGNLSVGGTGKTPLLIELLDDPLRPAETVVLTRGYKSPWERGFYMLRGDGPHSPGLTDEALLINQSFPRVPVFLGKNRAHTSVMAEKWFRPQLLLLDDGFQYRRLARDIDLVLWDSTMNRDAVRLLPHGRLREPPQRLALADGIVLTRCESSSSGQREFWRKWLESFAPKIPVVETLTVPTGWIDPSGNATCLDNGPKRAVAFAAIACPEPFFRLLEKIGCAVSETRAFRDHHVFKPAELLPIATIAANACAKLVCTEKDRVKIDAKTAREIGLWTLRTRMTAANGEPVCTALRRLGLLP